MESLEQDVATCGHENKKRKNIKQELHPNSEYTLQKRLELYKSKHFKKCFLELFMHFLFLLKVILKWVETKRV
jgi:cytoskeletal protein RodZ